MSTAATMPAIGPALKPPTQNEIMKLLRERMPGLAIYNPSDQWVRMQVHGIEHFLPPDLGGAVVPHPTSGAATECDGVYLIRGRFLTQKDSSGKLIEGQDAQSVVAFVIHRERYGEMGVVWLPGRSDEEDEAMKSLGRDKWLEYQQLSDDRVIARRREFKANWERNPARQGVPVPPPTPVENSAMERLQEREHKRAYGFECGVDECPGYATDDWTKYAQHMAVAHKVAARRTTKGIVTLTNAAGDTTTLAPMSGTDGKPMDIKDEISVDAAGGIAEARDAFEAKAPKAAVKRGKKKGG